MMSAGQSLWTESILGEWEARGHWYVCVSGDDPVILKSLWGSHPEGKTDTWTNKHIYIFDDFTSKGASSHSGFSLGDRVNFSLGETSFS